MANRKKSFFAAAVLAASAMGATAAQAQMLLPDSPIRVQVGNGPALLGAPGDPVAIGVSVLSNSTGTTATSANPTAAGTSIRLLGDDKIAGVWTTAVKPGGSPLALAVVQPTIQALTTSIVK